MRASRLVVASLAALALLAGCGGGDDQADTVATTPVELTAGQETDLTIWTTIAHLWCEVPGQFTYRPASAVGPALDALEAAPSAPFADDRGTLPVRDAMSRSADEIRPCEPELAGRVDGALAP